MGVSNFSHRCSRLSELYSRMFDYIKDNSKHQEVERELEVRIGDLSIPRPALAPERHRAARSQALISGRETFSAPLNLALNSCLTKRSVLLALLIMKRGIMKVPTTGNVKAPAPRVAPRGTTSACIVERENRLAGVPLMADRTLVRRSECADLRSSVCPPTIPGLEQGYETHF